MIFWVRDTPSPLGFLELRILKDLDAILLGTVHYKGVRWWRLEASASSGFDFALRKKTGTGAPCPYKFLAKFL